MSEKTESVYQMWCNEIRRIEPGKPIIESTLILHDHGELCSPCMKSVLNELRALESRCRLLEQYINACVDKHMELNWAVDPGNARLMVDNVCRIGYLSGYKAGTDDERAKNAR